MIVHSTPFSHVTHDSLFYLSDHGSGSVKKSGYGNADVDWLAVMTLFNMYPIFDSMALGSWCFTSGSHQPNLKRRVSEPTILT